jgi:predicted amidophosphoribosyltransferase
MAVINLRRLLGRWQEGFALDLHTTGSTYLGDEYGHPRFENAHSEVGKLLYRLKNQNDLSGVKELVSTAATFMHERHWPIELIVPVPPSKSRVQQPVFLLAQALGEMLGLPCAVEAVTKVKLTPQLKDADPGTKARMAVLADVFRIAVDQVSNRNVLLFDDLYDSGATMKSITDRLYDDGHVAAVYALALTMTRTGARS